MTRRAPLLTISHLLAAGACSEQVALFRRTFGESAAITRANWRKAHAAGLDTMWAAHLLDAPARATYGAATASAWATYDAATAPARATYDAATASARATYGETRASALATYDAATASAWATYGAAIAPARATYDAATASAWATYGAAIAPALYVALLATFTRSTEN